VSSPERGTRETPGRCWRSRCGPGTGTSYRCRCLPGDTMCCNRPGTQTHPSCRAWTAKVTWIKNSFESPRLVEHRMLARPAPGDKNAVSVRDIPWYGAWRTEVPPARDSMGELLGALIRKSTFAGLARRCNRDVGQVQARRMWAPPMPGPDHAWRCYGLQFCHESGTETRVAGPPALRRARSGATGRTSTGGSARGNVGR
jgi:hypothetical protein